jgi:hypothetical protein
LGSFGISEPMSSMNDTTLRQTQAGLPKAASARLTTESSKR